MCIFLLAIKSTMYIFMNVYWKHGRVIKRIKKKKRKEKIAPFEGLLGNY